MTIYLPTDGDIYYFLKKYIKDNKNIEKLFSRSHQKTLWKSYIEYNRFFGSMQSGEKETIQSKAIEVVSQYCDKEQVIIESVEPKIIINLESIYIAFEDGCVPYAEVFDKNEIKSEGISKFYYIYGPDKLLSNKHHIIDELKSLV